MFTPAAFLNFYYYKFFCPNLAAKWLKTIAKWLKITERGKRNKERRRSWGKENVNMNVDMHYCVGEGQRKCTETVQKVRSQNKAYCPNDKLEI